VTEECEMGLKSDIALRASEEEGPGESGLPLRATCIISRVTSIGCHMSFDF
jgi:hypothetical protein